MLLLLLLFNSFFVCCWQACCSCHWGVFARASSCSNSLFDLSTSLCCGPYCLSSISIDFLRYVTASWYLFCDLYLIKAEEEEEEEEEE